MRYLCFLSDCTKIWYVGQFKGADFKFGRCNLKKIYFVMIKGLQFLCQHFLDDVITGICSANSCKSEVSPE